MYLFGFLFIDSVFEPNVPDTVLEETTVVYVRSGNTSVLDRAVFDEEEDNDSYTTT